MNRPSDPDPAADDSSTPEGNGAGPASGLEWIARLAAEGGRSADAWLALTRPLFDGLPSPQASIGVSRAVPGPGLREREEDARIAALVVEWQHALTAVMEDLAAVAAAAGEAAPPSPDLPDVAAPGPDRVQLAAWIEAAEAAWAERAFGEEGAGRMAGLLHAWLRWRVAHDARLDATLERPGLPSRRELDEVHRRLDGMRRTPGR